MNLFVGINLFCAAAFLGYGVTCLFSGHMVSEFERYGLARFRVLTGVLQLMAAAGLLIGLRLPMIGALAASGLALQMLLGFAVRIKIQDGFWQSMPAFVFCLVSGWLLFQFLDR